MEVQRLDPLRPADWRLIPMALARVVAFAEEEHGIVPPLLALHFLTHFAGGLIRPDQVELACWVGVDEGVVRAHTLVEFANEHGLPYLVISQHASDRGFPYGQAALRILEEIMAWGRQKGALRIRTQARSRSLARAYRAFYGFRELQRVVMEREL